MAIVVRHGTEGQRLGLLGALAGSAGGRGGSRFVGRGQGTRGDQQAAAGLGQSSPEDMARLRLREAEIGLRNQAIEAQRKRLELDEKKLGIEEGEKAAKRELLGQQFDQAVNDSESELGRILDGRPEEQIKALRRLNPEDQQVMLEEWSLERNRADMGEMFSEAQSMAQAALADPEVAQALGTDIEESIQELQELLQSGESDRETLGTVRSGLTDMKQAIARMDTHLTQRRDGMAAMEQVKVDLKLTPGDPGYDEWTQAMLELKYSRPGANVAELVDIARNSVDIASSRELSRKVEERMAEERAEQERRASIAPFEEGEGEFVDRMMRTQSERDGADLSLQDPSEVAIDDQAERRTLSTEEGRKGLMREALRSVSVAAPVEQKLATMVAALSGKGLNPEDYEDELKEILHGGD